MSGAPLPGFQGMTIGESLPPGKRPSDQLGLGSWIQLLQLAGHWDPAVSAEEVWQRLDQWDRDQLAAQEAAQ